MPNVLDASQVEEERRKGKKINTCWMLVVECYVSALLHKPEGCSSNEMSLVSSMAASKC